MSCFALLLASPIGWAESSAPENVGNREAEHDEERSPGDDEGILVVDPDGRDEGEPDGELPSDDDGIVVIDPEAEPEQIPEEHADGGENDGDDPLVVEGGANNPYETVVRARPPRNEAEAGRAATGVGRRMLEERIPRSAPDALRYEPGTYVQQTAHGQGSAYIRGLTGQQTVLLFDGIRLNNATFRQGPNQYFFTVDSYTVVSIEVLRGSASVLYGSDALGGVIDTMPLEPRFLVTTDRFRVTPRTVFRLRTADDERGGRFQLEAQMGSRVGVVAGVGYRTVGLLESSGPVTNPQDGEIPEVPRFLDDNRTQYGTGFDELTFDGRIVVDLEPHGRLTAAAYGYMQLDAPRTDQCPPPFAIVGTDCLTYEEQFRYLTYLAFDGDLGRAARDVRISLSYQNQHERRRRDRTRSFLVTHGEDDVHTVGLVARATTDQWRPAPWLGLRLRYGTDLYTDWVSSWSETSFTNIDIPPIEERGLYIDGSSYVWWGLYAEGEARLPHGLSLRFGGRAAVTHASSPGDEESHSAPLDSTWFAPVFRGGAEWAATDALSILVNVDQGFRAPNLNDLTSRQQTGPGYQIENSELEPEETLTIETGLRLDTSRFRLSTWFFWTKIDEAILRETRAIDQCPPGDSACRASWHPFQLVNAREPSHILGVEAMAYLALPYGFFVRATLAYTWGEGPNPGEPPSDPEIEWEERVPLSRIPPLNGTIELRWRSREYGIFAGAGIRWAALQDRLALTDRSDYRIPTGGTPGYVVVDLRAGWRWNEQVLLSLVFENVLDTAYRNHGSAVNGPARGLMLNLELGL